MDDLQKAASEYFFFISKFEYAMKNSKFVFCGERDNDNNARPGWPRLLEKISPHVKIPKENENVKYLAKFPPKRQTFKNGVLGESAPQEISLSDSRGLIETCRTIRNNLFSMVASTMMEIRKEI